MAGNCGLSPVPGDQPWREEYYRYLEPVLGPIPKEFRPGSSQKDYFDNFLKYREALESSPLPINIGFLAGLGAIKTAVKGFSPLPFSPEEMARAQKGVREAYDGGALGLSTGLIYKPECYSSLEELIELAPAGSRKILCAHIRGEGNSLVQSIEEIIRVAESAGVPVNVSHFKATGTKNWRSLIHRAIEKIEAARDRGLEITADFYPYDAGSTTIMSLAPPVLQQDSMEDVCAKLAGKDGRDLLRREITKGHPGWDTNPLNTGWDRIIISAVNLPEHEAYCGRSMEAIAREEGFEDPADLMARLVAAEEGRVGIITISMAPEDIDCIARLPWTCLISDSLYSAAANPHPRLHGAFPKFLREYVRERHVLSMEEAIKKMTSMPAGRMGLANRGKIAPGCAADILVFDQEKFRDNADYSNPRSLATGLGTVILNGKIVYHNGEFFPPNGRAVTGS